MIDGIDDAKEMEHTRQACTLLGNSAIMLEKHGPSSDFGIKAVFI